MRKKSTYGSKKTLKRRIYDFFIRVFFIGLMTWSAIVCILFLVAHMGLSCDPKVMVMHYSWPITLLYGIILIVSRVIVGMLW